MTNRRASGRIAPLARVPIAFALLAMALLMLGSSMRADAAAAPITLSFDHLSTGFELDGVHRDLPCESCHLNAVFKGTPRNCGICHITGSTFNATPKTQTHIQSSNDCVACHNTISFRPDVHFDHHEVMGSCVSCHNGIIAEGKDPSKHPKTSDACEACHTVMSWNPPKAVDHTEIPLAVQGFCIICHNGTSATGKNKGHIATSLECGDCHLTTTWLGADFDHTGIKTGCFSCHNGVKAVGKQGNHMPTSTDCEACHTTGIGTKTPNWVPSGFDHRQMTVQTCATCHSGTVKISTGFVSGSPTNHVPLVPSAPDCGVCHGNTPAAETWAVLAASIPTLHSGLPTTNCILCHAGQTFAGVPAPYIPMSISGISPTKKTPLVPPHIPILAGSDCSVCHGHAYNAGGFGPATAMSATTHKAVSSTCDVCHDTGKSFYVGSGTPLQLRPANHVNSTDPGMATGDCSACHNTTDWTSKTMPVGHMPNPSNQPCVTCHASAPNAYTPATLAANSKLHTGITGNCGLCHGDNVTALTWAINYTPKDAILTPPHIPYLSGTDCSSCHSSSTYAVGTFGPMNMNAAKHAFTPPACNTCHEAGLSFTMGAASPQLQGRPSDHTGQLAAPNDCKQCHTTADWSSNVMPAGHMPNPGNQGCKVCHTTAPTDYTAATLATKPVLHTGISAGCATCHGGFTALTWANNYTPTDGVVGPPAHIPYTSGSDCSSCHAKNYVTGGFGATTMSAAKHAFVPAVCTTCHEANLTFWPGAALNLQGRPASHLSSGNPQEVSGDCSGCHNTTDWTSTAMPAGHMPTPGTQTCSVCHTAIGATEASYATLASVAILHTGITGNCSQCHGNYTAALTWYNNYTPKNANQLAPQPPHIPYLSGSDCSSCHAKTYATGGFAGTAMSAAKHAFVPTTCDTCHEAGLSFASTPALQGRPASHLSSLDAQQKTGDCSGCHNTTDWTSTAMPAGHMPTPGTKTCSVCHTAIGATEASYATLAPVAVLHTGITAGSCSQCHGSYTAALTWYNNYTPKPAFGLSPPHIPYLVGTDCGSCHASNYATGGFGPTNMSAAKHAFVPTTCNTCHDTGKSFYLGASTPALQTRPDGTGGTAAYDHIHNPSLPQMTTGDCSQCHNTTAWTTPKTLPGGHMPIPGTQTCTVCHVGGANFAILASTQILHTGIASGCGQCHGGATQLDFYHVSIPANFIKAAASLSPPHMPSFAGNDCSACHKSTTYAAGTFGPMNMTQATHASVSNVTCVTCHGTATGSYYIGAANPGWQLRPGDHSSGTMLTGDCGACHTTANWLSTTLPSGHMPNPGNQTCNVCHTSASTGNYKVFASNAVMHTGIAGNCAQCHGATTQLSFFNNDMVVKDGVLSPPHIPYISGVDCSSCHKTATYAAGTFGPMNMTQATHAFVATTCNTCHGTATVAFSMGAANPGMQLRPTDHTGNMAAPADCSGCHTTANWNSTTLPSGHMPNPANQACAVCHTGAPTNYKVFAANSVLHTGITGKCSQCHGTAQLSFYNNDMVVKSAVLSPPHIPFVSGTDCSSCHKTTTYAAGTFGPMNMTQATHAFVATTCNTCHGTTTVAFSMGAANPGMQLRPSNHTGNMAAPADCSGCHTTANWNSGTLPAGHMPNPGNQVCSTCHTSAPTNYKVFAANSVLHTGITGKCSQCHGTTQLSFYNNDMVVKSAVLAPPHIPFLSGTDCSSCHKSTTYAAGTFGPMNMTQATHAFVSTTCNTCHGTATVAFFMGAANPGMQLRPKADHTTGTMLTGDCSGCHTTANWNSGTMPAGHMPNPGNQACSVCHTAAPANYTTLASILVLHTGISTGCITCHGAPNVAKPVFANNYSPKAASGLSPPHIPSAATPCDSCHAKTYAAAGFSGTTMSSAKHTQLLANTGGTCDQCHDLTTLAFYGVSNLQHRPNGHHVGKDCNGCHGTNNWNAAQVRKTAAAPATTKTKVGIVANTGLQARLVNRGVLNEPGVHLPGAGLVGGIAGSAAVAPGAASATGITRINHAGVIANCVSCHNGVLATGKGPRHIASNNTCENCHTTFAWMPAHFDHRGITATCLSCHNGAAAPGKPTRHIQTNQDCSACHGTIAWAPANFNHLGINATCQSCHNGVAATAKQLGHLATTLDCGSCHSTLNWTTTIQSAPLKPLISRPKPSPRPRGPVNGPAK